MHNDEIARNARLNRYSSKSIPNLDDMSVLFALGSPSISGGTNFILNYAHKLRTLGAKVTIGLFSGKPSDTVWHPTYGQNEFIDLSRTSGRYFDLGICTYWRTVRPMLNAKCSRYLYLMQALETRFGLNEGDFKAAVEASFTYMLGLPVVANASWMSNLIAVNTTSKTWYVPAGIDKSLFNLTGRRELSKFTVLVEGNYSVKAKNVPESLQACIDAKVPRIIYATPVSHRRTSNYEVHTRVPFSQMPNLFKQSHLILKMSKSEGAFGPPIEAFHCGATAVVSKVTGYDEYILNNENSITVDIDDFDKARDTLIELQDSPDVLETLQFKAIKTAENWPSISESALLFANVCSAVVNSPYTLIDTHWAREQLDGAQYHYLRNPQYVNWALE